MTHAVDPRRAVIVNLNRPTYLTRLFLLDVLNGEPDARLGAARYLFRTADVIGFFANLTCRLLITGGQMVPDRDRGTSERVRLIHDVFAAWLEGCFFGGRLSLPPVNDTQGMLFVSIVLDTAEAHLTAIGARGQAERVASLRFRIEAALQRSGGGWVLSPTYLRHVGHLVYAASLIEQHRRGAFTGPPPEILAGPSPNATLLGLFRDRILSAVPAGTRYVEMISARKRHLRSDGRVSTMSETVSDAATAWATERPFADLPANVREHGDLTLAGLGVPRDAPVVTLHVRQPGYNHHIAWDMGLRDARIADYRAAIDYLAGTGTYVVRLGDPSMARAEPHERLIDYPFTDAKSDVLDVYLAARCRFHIGTSSGMSFVPLLFGRPTLFTNWITLAHMVCSPNVVTLPKLLLDSSGVVVPMAVWCERHPSLLERPDVDLHGLSFMDNEPQDIRDAVELMDRHIDPASGRLALPAATCAASQALFAASPLRTRPQIAPAFWQKHYA